jgi:hypothetical protein
LILMMPGLVPGWTPDAVRQTIAIAMPFVIILVISERTKRWT